jgi:hypothetical protein
VFLEEAGKRNAFLADKLVAATLFQPSGNHVLLKRSSQQDSNESNERKFFLDDHDELLILEEAGNFLNMCANVHTTAKEHG